MRKFAGIFFLLPLLGLFTGCARVPSNQSSLIPAQTIYSEIMLNSQALQINPSYYYIFALGVDQTSNSGPVPVTSGTEFTNGWGTLNNLPAGEVQQPPLYVQFNNGTFYQYVQDGPNGTNWVYLGAPYNSGTRFDGTNWHIWVEVDQSLLTQTLPGQTTAPLIPLGTTSPIVQANWITVATITVPPEQQGYVKQYDGFGAGGNGYLTPIALNVPQTWTSGEGGVPAQPTNETTTMSGADPGYDLDIVWWTVSVKIYHQATASHTRF